MEQHAPRILTLCVTDNRHAMKYTNVRAYTQTRTHTNPLHCKSHLGYPPELWSDYRKIVVTGRQSLADPILGKKFILTKFLNTL